MSRRRASGRRAFLVVLGVGAASLLAWGLRRRRAIRPRAGPLIEAVLAQLSDPGAARRIGAALLAARPAPATADELRAQLVAAPRWRGAAPEDAPRLFAAQVRDDFARDRTARVQGWVLAESEARLYMLLALGSR